RFLVSSSYDGMLRIWRIEGDALEPGCSTVLPGAVWARSVAFGDGGRILMGTFGTTYAVFDPARDTWDVDAVCDTPGINNVYVAGGSVFAVGDAGRVLKDGAEVARLGGPGNFVTAWRGR